MKKQNEKLIHQFYSSFSDFDADGMAVCYHEDIYFEDPAFGPLHGSDAMHMWRMLIAHGKPTLQITFGNIVVDERSGSADWEAKYLFSKTNRMVHNKIKAEFEFKEGKIVRHVDTFNLHHWATMAFGWKGRLFGVMPFFKNKIRSTALKGLAKWKKQDTLA